MLAPQPKPAIDHAALAADIRRWAAELGFQQAGIADVALDAHEQRLLAWLDAGRHGTMDYMQRRGPRSSCRARYA
jgi:epoxyqueuosine reductase